MSRGHVVTRYRQMLAIAQHFCVGDRACTAEKFERAVLDTCDIADIAPALQALALNNLITMEGGRIALTPD